MATSRHPAHTLPHSRDDRYLRGDPREMYYRDRERRPYRDYGHHQQYEFRDHEREAYEREREIERELELDYERYANQIVKKYRKNPSNHLSNLLWIYVFHCIEWNTLYHCRMSKLCLWVELEESLDHLF